MDIHLSLQNPTLAHHVPNEDTFTHWVKSTLNACIEAPNRPSIDICIRIVSCAESQALNDQFRNKNKPTNVLSFPNTPDPCFNDDSLGDIAICADLVASESQAMQRDLTHHWAHLTVHGVLHLLGYDHEHDDDADVMESKERTILAALGIPDPYME